MSFAKFRAWLAALSLLLLVACGGGSNGDAGTPLLSDSSSTPPAGGGSASNAAGTMSLSLSSSAISSATPATVTATLVDTKGAAVAGQVVTFKTDLGLGKTNIGTALTNSVGQAVVILAPASSTVAGADQIVASATLGGESISASQGFQIQSTDVTLTTFTSAVASLGAYGQTTLTLGIAGASVGSPVNISVTSSCVSLGKATLSPSTFTATTATVDLQLKDNGCGAVQAEDKLQAAIVGSASTLSLQLPVLKPDASSLAFISATPELIYLKGSGFTESSTLVFEVRDRAGNTLPNRLVVLSLLTKSGGVTLEGGTDTTQQSDANGRVTVRINSGTMPTPVRVEASLTGTSPAVKTVSSNLSVGVGLPSQLNFSLSQQTKNIEGFGIDGTPNTYNIIASDRSGNPVPTGTSINFVTEGGQIEAVVQTSTTPVPPAPGTGTGLSTAVARFQSAAPRPADGRVTVTAYMLGEESFIDQNGNNTYDVDEPFQDLGQVFKDRVFDGAFDVTVDEYVPTNINDVQECKTPDKQVRSVDGSLGGTVATDALLALDPSIPSIGGYTCDGNWSGAGKVYVRRATETVLSTSAARPLWANTSKLSASCSKITLQDGPLPTNTKPFTLLDGDTWYSGGAAGTLTFYAADANPIRFNPMAAGTTISASTIAKGVTLTVGGSPVPSTTEASLASVAFEFDVTATPPPPATANVLISFTSPSGLKTTYSVLIDRVTTQPSNCP